MPAGQAPVRVGEDDVRAVVGAVGVHAVPAAREVQHPLHLAAPRAQRVLRGQPVGEAGAGPLGLGVGRSVGGGLGVAGDDPDEVAASRRPCEVGLPRNSRRTEAGPQDLADVAVVAAAVGGRRRRRWCRAGAGPASSRWTGRAAAGGAGRGQAVGSVELPSADRLPT